jgi:hypothetical protein
MPESGFGGDLEDLHPGRTLSMQTEGKCAIGLEKFE